MMLASGGVHSCSEVYSCRTSLHVCSVEVFPGRGDVFACGLYELQEGQGAVQEEEEGGDGGGKGGVQERQGGVVICNAANGEALAKAPRPGGVLDMKPRPGGQPRQLHLAAAYSTSRVEVLEYAEDEKMAQPALESAAMSSACDEEGLLLSVSWCGEAQLAVSTQQGNVVLYAADAGSSELRPSARIDGAHSLYGGPIPAWIVASDPHCRHRLLTGGDDCALRLWDTRQPPTLATDSVTKCYTAGVTSGEWHPAAEHVFAAGSYDETCRVWDSRAMRAPLCTLHTGGGVWRTKWVCPTLLASPASPAFPISPLTVSHLALACMQAGSAVFRVDLCPEASAWTAQGRQECHHSDLTAEANHLAYGIAVLGCREDPPELDVVSCSFYDNKVSRWIAPLQVD